MKRGDAVNGQDVEPLRGAIAALPAGRWGVAVSGGADSVALLRALCDQRPDLSLHVIHLNHQTRGADSDEDARFVAMLCTQLSLPCTIARRDEIKGAIEGALPSNPSARYRALRLELYRRTVEALGLAGVVLAHHADDQAETVLQRLLRGAGCLPLAGIRADTRVGNVRLLRPLLGVRRHVLRQYLMSTHQSWREDASNASDAYQRNRVRKVLAEAPGLSDALLDLSAGCRAVSEWTASAAPKLSETFAVTDLQRVPSMLAEAAARQWLVARGCPRAELSDAVAGRLVTMATDAASPARDEFPGRVRVKRRGGRISQMT